MLAFASAALAEAPVWTMERYQQADCGDPTGPSIIGSNDVDNQDCRDMYNSDDAADPEVFKNLPDILAVNVTWTGDLNAFVYKSGDNKCDKHDKKKLVRNECIAIYSSSDDHTHAVPLKTWRFTDNDWYWLVFPFVALHIPVAHNTDIRFRSFQYRYKGQGGLGRAHGIR